MTTPQANPEPKGAQAPAEGGPPEPEAAPVRELDRLEQQAQELLDQAAEDIEARSKPKEEPPAGEPAAPGAWDAKAWERFAHSASSAAAFGKEMPKLPDGVGVATAPEPMRPMLGALGYKAEGEEPEEEAAPPRAAEFRPELLAPAILQTDPDYQLDIREAIEGAATREEQAKAMREVNERYAEDFMGKALDLLGLSRLKGDELDEALEGIDGLFIPRDAADPVQMLTLYLSAQAHVERERQATRPPSQAEIDKAREGYVKVEDLEAIAARQEAAASVQRGDLVSAAGAGQATDGEAVPTEEQMRSMTVEQAVELEKKGLLDKGLQKMNT